MEKLSQLYTLSPRWIIKHEKHMSLKYLAYNIDEDKKGILRRMLCRTIKPIYSIW